MIKEDNVLYTLEGYLFLDTYYIPLKAKEEKIIDIMLKRFNEIFSEEYKKRAEEIDMSINDIITIASLIEKEAANDKERSRISGVIYNRLKKGMPLQIDAFSEQNRKMKNGINIA
ncbi:endolytic transglycosylase MltG [Tepidibacter formicigenes]|uniref:endolytic transglycosylase MltG n=1 Tax=Tepidibacter formicigenes TaxID=227138 RepID=UPI000A0332C7|nr:endolytic transglycosylase MltG [Tepidibacter formicigenes]